MRLMLKLLAFDRTDDELGWSLLQQPEVLTDGHSAADQKWFLPSTVLPSSITASLGALNHFLTAPPSLDDDPKSLLRRVHKRARRAPSASGSGSDQEDRPKKIRKKKQAETQIFKSAAFIVDSDDDEEADAAFFAKERELRAEMEALAAKHGTSMLVTGTRERKRKGNGKGKEVDGEATQILGIDEEDKEIRATGPAGYTQPDGSVSSASESEGDWVLKRRVSGKTRRTSSMSDSDGDSEDRPTQAKLKPGRARLVDSEEDE